MSKKIHNSNKFTSQKQFIRNNTTVQVEDFEQQGNNKLVFLSIKNLQYSYQCFSDWDKTEMKKFWSLNEKIHKMTWQDVYNSANKGEDKRGLAYTPLPREKYKSIAYIKNLSKDIDLFELRVDGGMRVHGYRQNAVFYICVLDKKHEICR